jgi:RNA-directed DNA polymerase
MGLRDDRRRNIQSLDFGLPGPGEAREPGSEETGSSGAAHGTESPADTNRLMEAICEWKNLREAVHRVWANKGSAGIDGRGVGQRPGYRELAAIREQMLRGDYRPQPVKRVEIPKPTGGMRQLGIPTVGDRIVQQAVLQVLQKYWEPTFSDHSYGFRPGRSAHQAVVRAQEYIAAGNGWVVDLDLEKFFDRVHHDRLMSRIAGRIRDKRLLRLIRAFLNAGVMDQGIVRATREGTPQGGPLSPLLSNIVLDELDRELERRGHRFVRYADDCNIYVRSERAGRRVMDSVTRFITGKLRLRVNESKSAVARPRHRKFLGFSFTGRTEIRRRIAPQSVARFKRRVREITRRTPGIGLKATLAELIPYLRGWRSYFGFCQTPSVLEMLTRWVRRRLRCALWRQWKTWRRRRAALLAGGVSIRLASQTAASRRGPWALSHSPAVHAALSNAYFRSLGLPSLVGDR